MKCKFTCDGFRPIVKDDGFPAAKYFASVAARRECGRRADVAALRLDSWTQDGTVATYEAFIGSYDRKSRSTTGRNIWLHISSEPVRDYEYMVELFNSRISAVYVAELRFLTFRRTKKGILVGYTCGKPDEVAQLRRHVAEAGEPFYCK